MGAGQRTGLDVGELLAAVENAPPVAAAGVVGEVLAKIFGVSKLAFLIADYSGEALIRLSHAGAGTAKASQGREIAERVPLANSAHGRALAQQAVQVERQAAGWQLLAPVTNRGEAIGIL